LKDALALLFFISLLQNLVLSFIITLIHTFIHSQIVDPCLYPPHNGIGQNWTNLFSITFVIDILIRRSQYR